MKIGEDLYVWIEIARRYRVCFSPERLARYARDASNRSAASYTPERTRYSFEALYDPAPPRRSVSSSPAQLQARLILSARATPPPQPGPSPASATRKPYRRTLRKVRLLNRLPAGWRAPLLNLYNNLAWRLARKGL